MAQIDYQDYFEKLLPYGSAGTAPYQIKFREILKEGDIIILRFYDFVYLISVDTITDTCCKIYFIEKVPTEFSNLVFEENKMWIEKSKMDVVEILDKEKSRQAKIDSLT
jgi:hypothetical protein